MELWSSADCAVWQAALDAYPAAVANSAVRGLVELDEWYRAELPGLLAARSPGYATLDELERVTSWKMKRGVWRERNRRLVGGNPPAEVEAATREAFAAVPDTRRPIAIISRLAGVGPATASALLAAHSPSVYPFFDEVVAAQIPGLGPVAFTAPYYARYSERLRERAAELRAACLDRPWTAQDVSQALWAAADGKKGSAAS